MAQGARDLAVHVLATTTFTDNGTAWLAGITAAITAVGALVLNMRSKDDQKKQQDAAEKIHQDKHRLEETKQALDALQQMYTNANADADRYRARAEEERQRADSAEDELDEQRELHRKMYSAQEARCREYASDLTDVILMLRHVVLDEVANAAATMALHRDEHPHPDRERTALPAPVITREEAGDGDVADLDDGR